MSGPRVSIVLPSRNGSRHVDEAIGSVLAQTSKDWELVLVDDGSTDDTGRRMQDFAARDPRVRVVHLDPNRGLPAALNEGFRHATGALCGWISDDNAFLPGALERMAGRLAEGAPADVVYADYLCFDESGREWRTHVASTRWLALKNVIGSCFLYRREVHDELGGFDERLFLAEDYDFWLRALSRFRFEAVPEVLYRCRVHADSLTARRGPDILRAVATALDQHLPALSAPERAHALLLRSHQLSVRGEAREARRRLLRAALESPRVVLGERHARRCAAGVLARPRLRRLAPPARDEMRAIRLFLPDYLGGVTTWNANLAAARPAGSPRIEVHWLDQQDLRARNASDLTIAADRVVRVAHDWPRESLFAVLRRLHRQVTRDPGILLANEFFGLAYAARYGAGRPVVQILHGDLPLYYDLATAFEPWVDAFVTVSARIRDELLRRLPWRSGDVRHLRSGVPVPAARRAPSQGPLRLAYSGRLERSKGVFELPEIDGLLRRRGVDVAWTVLGAGPDEAALRRAFGADTDVHFSGALPYDEVPQRLLEQDVLVLPSHAEGLSLALLEAMAAGVVPVASDLESGMREVIDPGETGFLARPGRPEEFAEAITALAAQRDRLEQVSMAAANRIAQRHALAPCAAAFYALLDDLGRRPVPYRPPWTRGPSRLDRPWLPGPVVRAIRAASGAHRSRS